MSSPARAPYRTIGRCPDCGDPVEVERTAGRPGTVRPHGCPVRACEHPRCGVTGVRDQMVQPDKEVWYCPAHGLLVVAAQLVALHRVADDHHRAAIRAILDDTLPGLVSKARRGLTGIVAADAARRS